MNACANRPAQLRTQTYDIQQRMICMKADIWRPISLRHSPFCKYVAVAAKCLPGSTMIMPTCATSVRHHWARLLWHTFQSMSAAPQFLNPWFWLELGSFGRIKSGFTLCKISVQLYGTAPTTIDRRSPPHPGSAPFSRASCMRLETMRAWDFYLQVGTPTSVPLGPLTQTDCQPDGKSAGIP